MYYAFISLIALFVSAVLTAYLFNHVSFFALMFIYQIASGIACLAFLVQQKGLVQEAVIFKRYLSPMAILLLFGALDGFGWFASLYYNGLSGHAILGRLATVVLIGYGLIYLKEKINPLQLLACALLVGSSILYVFQIESTQDVMGIIAIAMQAIGYSVFAVQQKKFSTIIDPAFMLMVRSFVLGTAVLAAAFLLGSPPASWILSADIIFWAAIAGIFGSFINHYLVMKAFATEYLSIVIAIRSSSPIFLFLFGVLVLGESGSLTKYASACVMMIGMGVIIYDHLRAARKLRIEAA